MRKAGGERGRLAEVAVQVDDPQVPVALPESLKTRARVVLAAVVDEDRLVGDVQITRDAPQLSVERAEISRFVVDRDDEGQPRGRWRLRHLPKKATTASTTRSTSVSVRSGCTGSERISRAACSARGSGGISPNARSQAGCR